MGSISKEISDKRSFLNIKDANTKSQEHTPIDLILQQNGPELGLVLISPKLVANNEYSFVLDDLHRSKFGIAAVKKQPIVRSDLNIIFEGLAPHQFNLNLMWDKDFSKNNSEVVLVVVEKEKCLNDLEQVVGRFMIKESADFEKTKRK